MGVLRTIAPGVQEYQDGWKYTTKGGRLTVCEGFGAYYIIDNNTGKEACMGDGVDMLYDPETYEVYLPGNEQFHRILSELVETGEGEYIEAYFAEN